MGRKKKYPNAAARQKAFRIRHGQKRKVPLEMRRGVKLGSGEGDLRAKKEDETWEEYKVYIDRAVKSSRAREKGATAFIPMEGQKSGVSGEMGEEFYEVQREKEEAFAKLGKGRKLKKGRKQK